MGNIPLNPSFLSAMQWEILKILKDMGDYTPVESVLNTLRSQFHELPDERFFQEADDALNKLWKMDFILLPGIQFVPDPIEDIAGLISERRILTIQLCLGEKADQALKNPSNYSNPA